MVFAELAYSQPYEKMHADLEHFLRASFPTVKAGLQGDSWIWVIEGEEKVAVDTFTSMRHEVKAAKDGPLVRKVLDALASEYKLSVHRSPQPEPHEGCD